MAKHKHPEKAYNNREFLESSDARTIRILSEFYEPQARFKKNNVVDTIVFFGSARIRSLKEAKAMLSKFKRKKERIIVNAMFFSAAHVFLFEFLIGATVPFYIFILGFFLAKLYEEYRSVLPCILLHFLNNALVFAIDFAKVKHLFF